MVPIRQSSVYVVRSGLAISRELHLSRTSTNGMCMCRKVDSSFGEMKRQQQAGPRTSESSNWLRHEVPLDTIIRYRYMTESINHERTNELTNEFTNSCDWHTYLKRSTRDPIACTSSCRRSTIDVAIRTQDDGRRPPSHDRRALSRASRPSEALDHEQGVQWNGSHQARRVPRPRHHGTIGSRTGRYDSRWLESYVDSAPLLLLQYQHQRC